MTTYEFSTLALPDNLTITSSIMPQKKNQAVLEFIKGRHSHILGAVVTAFTAVHASPFSHTLDANADSLPWAWDGLKGLADILPAANLTVREAIAKPERMHELVLANYATATDFADFLVTEFDMPFKQSHHLTGKVISLALERGLRADEITPEIVQCASEALPGKAIIIEKQRLADVFCPHKALKKRRGSGGPDQEDIRQILADSSRLLSEDERHLTLFSERITQSECTQAAKSTG